jgi:CelD/BcsL family acetyltransferase involved in cellulose biosynthesis
MGDTEEKWTPGMDITIIKDKSAFKDLKEEWDDLLERSTTNVPFLRHDFQYVWWSTLGGGEWAEGDLWLAVGRNEAGDLVGIAPLWVGTTLEDQRGLMFIGTKEIADYLDLIVTTEFLTDFVSGLFDALEKSGPERWQVLDLFNILDRSPTLEALSQEAEERGWRVEREELEPCPVVTLEGGWEGYMGRLEGKYRHELRRKIRRANSYPLSVSWRRVGRDEEIGPHIETFIDLMEHDPEKVEFLTPQMREHFRRSIRAAHEGGWLMMAFLDVGSHPGAAYLNYDYANRIWVYNSGLDPEFYSLSPGWVLMAHIIEWAIEAGREAVDFLRGHEKYKYRLGGVPRRIYRLRIRP